MGSAEKPGLPLQFKIFSWLIGVDTSMIQKIWDWFSGKKTVVGAIITVVAFVASGLGVVLTSFGVDAILVAKVIGIATTVVGVLHKIYKFLYKEEHP